MRDASVEQGRSVVRAGYVVGVDNREVISEPTSRYYHPQSRDA